MLVETSPTASTQKSSCRTCATVNRMAQTNRTKQRENLASPDLKRHFLHCRRRVERLRRMTEHDAPTRGAPDFVFRSIVDAPDIAQVSTNSQQEERPHTTHSTLFFTLPRQKEGCTKNHSCRWCITTHAKCLCLGEAKPRATTHQERIQAMQTAIAQYTNALFGLRHQSTMSRETNKHQQQQLTSQHTARLRARKTDCSKSQTRRASAGTCRCSRRLCSNKASHAADTETLTERHSSAPEFAETTE